MKSHRIALHVSDALSEEKRCCWVSVTDVCCWQCGFLRFLYPRLSSVQPFADSHVNLCNPNASSCSSQ